MKRRHILTSLAATASAVLLTALPALAGPISLGG